MSSKEIYSSTSSNHKKLNNLFDSDSSSSDNESKLTKDIKSRLLSHDSIEASSKSSLKYRNDSFADSLNSENNEHDFRRISSGYFESQNSKSSDTNNVNDKSNLINKNENIVSKISKNTQINNENDQNKENFTSNNIFQIFFYNLIATLSKSSNQCGNNTDNNMGQNDKPYVINIVNSIIGVAILAIASTFKDTGVILTLITLVCGGILTSYSVSLLVRAAKEANTTSYEYLCYYHLGTYGKTIVELCLTGFMLGVMIGYYIALGDLLPPILFGDNLGPEHRTKILTIIGFILVQPLVLIKDITSITKANSASLCGYAIVTSIIIFKAFVSGSFFQILGSFNFLSNDDQNLAQLVNDINHDLEINPNINNQINNIQNHHKVSKVHNREVRDTLHDYNHSNKNKLIYWDSTHFFSTMSLFALGFACHPQVFIVYKDLKSKTGKIQIPRMERIVNKAVSYVGLLYTTIGLCGYLTFTNLTSGNLLTNYNNSSMLTKLMRCSFCFSCIISFPILIFPVRQSIFTLLKQFLPKLMGSKTPSSINKGNYMKLDDMHDDHDIHVGSSQKHSNTNKSMSKNDDVFIPNNIFIILSFIINLLCLYTAIVTPDIATMLKLTGATMGSMLCFILPALICLFRIEPNNQHEMSKEKLQEQGLTKQHYFRAKLLLVIGILVFVITPITILIDEDTEIYNKIIEFEEELEIPT